jgi:propanol-preferring alcohol dehydrogenase
MQVQQPGPAETRPLRPVELPLPEPGRGQIRVRVEACGVCHTDLHEVEGDVPLPRLPLVPGHEVVGMVDRLGPDVTEPAPGTRVGVPWLASTCGRCRFCLSGRENLCDNIRFTGLHVDGGYAEYAVARAGFCYTLPPGEPTALAPLLCAGVIGYRALRLALHLDPSDPRPPGLSRVGLFGFGASAHISLQIARHWRCDVAVFTRSDAHRRLALELGATWAGTADDAPPWPLDSAVIFAPAGDLVPRALVRLNKGGTLTLAGIHMSPIPRLDYQSIYHERTVRSVANSTRQDVIDLIALAAAVPLRTTVEPFPLASAGDALLAVKHSRIRGAAVLHVG